MPAGQSPAGARQQPASDPLLGDLEACQPPRRREPDRLPWCILKLRVWRLPDRQHDLANRFRDPGRLIDGEEVAAGPDDDLPARRRFRGKLGLHLAPGAVGLRLVSGELPLLLAQQAWVLHHARAQRERHRERPLPVRHLGEHLAAVRRHQHRLVARRALDLREAAPHLPPRAPGLPAATECSFLSLCVA